jgi:hypothetical protein
MRTTARKALTLLLSVTATASTAAGRDCSDAIEAASDMIITGDQQVTINCSLNPGRSEFPLVYFIRRARFPIDDKIAFTPMLSEGEGLELALPEDQWCSEAGGVVAINVVLNCEEALGLHDVWFTSGAMTSPATRLRVISGG